MSESFGTIPQSEALGEALPTSLSELFNRNVEQISDSDIAGIIAEFRQMRERFAAAEAAPKERATRKIASPKVANLVAKLNADEMGL